MSTFEAQAKELIKLHEGLRLKPYRCTADKLTIGFGRNIEDMGITPQEACILLATDVKRCIADMESFEFWPQLNSARKAALLDMRYNLGATRFRKFKKMIKALNRGDFAAAASEMRDSQWFNQVGGRAMTLSQMIRAGE